MLTPWIAFGTCPLGRLTTYTRILHIFGTVLAALLALPLSASATTVVCKELRLKPLHCVRGAVIDPVGEPAPGVTVTIVKDGVATAKSKTDEKGHFSFGVMEPGNYELRVQAEGFLTEHIPIIVKKPRGKCRRALEIRLRLAYPYQCTYARVVRKW
jgi:hypothetical protein